jgi:hypothetical protein
MEQHDPLGRSPREQIDQEDLDALASGGPRATAYVAGRLLGLDFVDAAQLSMLALDDCATYVENGYHYPGAYVRRLLADGEDVSGFEAAP